MDREFVSNLDVSLDPLTTAPQLSRSTRSAHPIDFNSTWSVSALEHD